MGVLGGQGLHRLVLVRRLEGSGRICLRGKAVRVETAMIMSFSKLILIIVLSLIITSVLRIVRK